MSTVDFRPTLPDTYMPHPAPARTTDNRLAMGQTAGVLLNLLVPALLSLFLFLIISYAVIPLWQRYRGRYSRYVPLEAISTHTSSARQRVQGLLAEFLLPSRWRSDYQSSRFAASAREDSESAFDDEDGEELFEIIDGRREALSLDERRGRDENQRRLSRDLEEGFRDDSDNDETTTNSIGITR